MKVSGVVPLSTPNDLSTSAGTPQGCRSQAREIVRISRVVSDLGRAQAFYCDTLGFRVVAEGRCEKRTLESLGPDLGDADEVVMRLGAQDIALVRFASKARPYPKDSRSDDLWFQHLAIVVSDMAKAYAYLSSHSGWHAISEEGPQLLPPSSGAVRAFKFCDPDGHPLELIWFPPAQGRPVWHERPSNRLFLGIDHSALSISNTLHSLSFYRGLGLRVTHRSLNLGPAQSRLDGLPCVHVKVTGLRPDSTAGPGLELLGYQPPGRPANGIRPNDMVTDWITLAMSLSTGKLPCTLQDPDGHRIVLVDQRVRGPRYLPEDC